MAKMIRHRKKMHFNHFDYTGSGHVYFLTICTVDKKPYLKNPAIARSIVNQLTYRRDNKEIKLFCYCIMPDHVHLLLSLTEVY